MNEKKTVVSLLIDKPLLGAQRKALLLSIARQGLQ